MTFCDANNWNTQQEKKIHAITYTNGDFPFDLEQNCAENDFIMGMAVQYDSASVQAGGILAIATKCAQLNVAASPN